MQTKSLEIQERVQIGTSNAQRVRKEGNIPAVIYADGKDAKSVTLKKHQFELTTRGSRPTQIYKFESNSSTLNGLMAIIKSVQVEPVKGQTLHVDFVSISDDNTITVAVPLEVYGESAAIKENRAFLFQAVYEIEVECLPRLIPEVVKVGIANLKEGGSLHASDVELPQGVKLKSQPTLTVVTAISKKALEEEQAKADAAAAAAATTAATATATTATATAAGSAATQAPAADAKAQAGATKQAEKKK